MDRTATFHLVTALPPRRYQPPPPSPFTVRASQVDYQISVLEAQVKNEHVILRESDSIQARMLELEKTLTGGMGDAVNQPGSTAQARQHMERVKQSLERRLKDAAKAFKQVLEAKAITMSTRQERQEQLFGISSPTQYFPAAAAAALPTRTALLPPSTDVRRRQGGPLIRAEYGQPFHHHHHQQQQQLEENYVDVKQRSTELQRVEKSITEVKQMFLRVAGLVNEQKDFLRDLEENLDNATDETNVAQSELLKLFRFVSGDRSLIIGLLIAVTVVGCIIIYFLT